MQKSVFKNRILPLMIIPALCAVRALFIGAEALAPTAFILLSFYTFLFAPKKKIALLIIACAGLVAGMFVKSSLFAMLPLVVVLWLVQCCDKLDIKITLIITAIYIAWLGYGFFKNYPLLKNAMMNGEKFDLFYINNQNMLMVITIAYAIVFIALAVKNKKISSQSIRDFLSVIGAIIILHILFVPILTIFKSSYSIGPLAELFVFILLIQRVLLVYRNN